MGPKLMPRKLITTAGPSMGSSYWAPLTAAQILVQWEEQCRQREEAERRAKEAEEELEKKYQAALVTEKAWWENNYVIAPLPLLLKMVAPSQHMGALHSRNKEAEEQRKKDEEEAVWVAMEHAKAATERATVAAGKHQAVEVESESEEAESPQNANSSSSPGGKEQPVVFQL
ncbi:hypothetical protein BU17DRAFT_80961 [Hysterangium stoloniferum]|nr:hypothetical protein BU17DRAFT_80961 [Hysterangium stoloniferum]